jgi:hypothetical protein
METKWKKKNKKLSQNFLQKTRTPTFSHFLAIWLLGYWAIGLLGL